MITQENKHCLREIIIDLKSKIEKTCEENVFGLSCLSLWNVYQSYIVNVLNKFPIYNMTKEVNVENVEILEFLEISEFNVTFKGEYSKEKKLIIDYANELLRNL